MKNTLRSMRRPAAWFIASIAAMAASGQVIWTGTPTSTNWSVSGNWSTGAAPDSSSDVRFFDVGAALAVSNVNNVVDGAFTVNSLQYAVTNGFHATLIKPGQTLTVQGALTAGTEATLDALKTNVITGPGGSLVVNNSGANLIVRQGPVAASGSANRTTLDMSGLDTFNATVARVLIGVGTGGGVNRATGRLILAKTNMITASSATVPAIDVGESGSNNGSGSSLILGQTNTIFADSLSVGRAKEGGCSMAYNSALTNCATVIRGSDGSSRMAQFLISDGGSGSGTFGGTSTVDFSRGSVDLLVDTNIVARANSNAGSAVSKAQVATLTFNGGVANINTLQIGFSPSANTNWGQGTVNVNGSTLLVVNTILELGRTLSTTAAGGDNVRGTLNINGGTVWVNQINANFAGTNNAINLNSATLAVSNNVGPGLNTFTVTNSTLQVALSLSAPAIAVTNLTTGGTNNYFIIGSVPIVTGYPFRFPLLKYTGSILGAGNNFSVKAFPASSGNPYAGTISNSPSDQTLYLWLTSGPTPANNLVWSGAQDSSWNWGAGTSLNWKTGGIATNFNQSDFVVFNDGATGSTSVSLDSSLAPSSVTVSNAAKVYTFGGGGNLTGPTGLDKQGAGTLILDNSGINDYAGTTLIEAGTLQIGNNDGSGNLPASGAITDNGALLVKRTDTLSVANPITGSGTVTENGMASGTLQLSGANNYTGATLVSSGTLQTLAGSALGATNGATTISSGATLDVFGQNLGYEQIFVSGAGVGGGGAIVNNNTAQTQALRYVTLLGDTTFGGGARWDIRGSPAALLTGGQPYKITKVGANQVSLVAVTNIDAALGDIDVQAGIFAVQTSTTQLGDSSKTLTVESGATLDVYSLSVPLNKNIVLNGDGATSTLFAESGSSTIAGPITLNGACLFNVAGTSLTLSNTVAGGGSVAKNGTGTLSINGAASYAGGTSLNNGILMVNGTLGGAVTTGSLTTLGGNGTCTGLVDANYFVTAGSLNAAGTMTFSGGLIMEGYASFLFDLTATNTASGGANDLIQVNGDLTLNGVPIDLNPLQGRLQAGRYRVINYTGALLGSGFGGAQTTNSSRYNFTVDTSTPNAVDVIVSGSAADLKWTSTSDTNWDIASSYNWVDSQANGTAFYNGDTITLDDSVSGVVPSLSIPTNLTVLPWAMTNISSANNYTIAGPGRIGGSAGLYKSGASTLTLLSSNNFTGPVTVQAGTLKVGNGGALGATNSGTTIAFGATLDVGGSRGTNDLNLGFEMVTVSGSGVGAAGAIINSSTNSQQNALRLVTLTGDTVFGGLGRWDIRSQAANTDVAGATNALLNTGGQAYNITKIGTNTVAVVGVLVDPALGNINVQQGILSIEHSSTLGAPAKTLTVTNGASLQFYQNWPSNQLNKTLVLYGDGTNASLINSSGANVFIGSVTLNSNCVLNITGNGLTLTNNTLGGPGSLIKTGTNTLTLGGAATYTGGTLVSTGRLALVGATALTGTTNLTVSSGATLDVSARTDATLTLSGSQVLQGAGTIAGSLVVSPSATLSPGVGGVGLLTVTNAATLSGTTLLDISGATNDVLQAGSIAYGGTLSLNFTAGTLTNGSSLKFFNASSYSGAFASLLPVTPGSGLKWDLSKLASSGTLGVVYAVVPRPAINSWTFSSAGLVLSGTNGTANATYHVLASTNVAAALDTWTPVSTNAFDSNGNFKLTNVVNPAVPAEFYLLVVPQ